MSTFNAAVVATLVAAVRADASVDHKTLVQLVLAETGEKVTQKAVKAYIAENAALFAVESITGQDTTEVNTQVQSKLGELLEQQKAPEQAPAQKEEKAAKPKIDMSKRDVIALVSESKKMVFLTARRNYSNKTGAAVIKRAQGKEKGAAVQELLKAEDLQCVFHMKQVLDSEAQRCKADVHAKYLADGWNVVSTCAKSVATPVTPAVAEVQDAPVQDAVEHVEDTADTAAQHEEEEAVVEA